MISTPSPTVFLFWLIGSMLSCAFMWGISYLLQVEALTSAQLWFGGDLIYVLPGISISFATQPQTLVWSDRLAWSIAASLLIMPSLLFLLTASGLAFTPAHQVIIGILVTLMSSLIFLLRLGKRKTSK